MCLPALACLLFVAMFVLVVDGQGIVTLANDKVEIYDRFDIQTSLIYFGGRIVIPCQMQNFLGDQCDESVALIGPDQAGKIAEEPCKKGDHVFRFEIRIDSAVKLGQYHCEYKGVKSTTTFGLRYRLCDDQADGCKKQPNCDGPNNFCYVYNPTDASPKETTQTCGRLSEDYCADAHIKDRATTAAVGRTCSKFAEEKTVDSAICEFLQFVLLEGLSGKQEHAVLYESFKKSMATRQCPSSETDVDREIKAASKWSYPSVCNSISDNEFANMRAEVSPYCQIHDGGKQQPTPPIPVLMYRMREYSLHQHIPIDQADKRLYLSYSHVLTNICEDKATSNCTCKVNGPQGNPSIKLELIKMEKSEHPRSGAWYYAELTDDIFDKSKVMGLECKFSQRVTGKDHAEEFISLKNTLVIFAGKATWITPDNPSCQFQPTPDEGFIVTSEKHTDGVTNHCEATISYKSCSPHATFTHKTVSSPYIDDKETGVTLVNPSTKASGTTPAVDINSKTGESSPNPPKGNPNPEGSDALAINSSPMVTAVALCMGSLVIKIGG